MTLGKVNGYSELQKLSPKFSIFVKFFKSAKKTIIVVSKRKGRKIEQQLKVEIEYSLVP